MTWGGFDLAKAMADLWFMDLRRTAVIRLAEAGATVPQITAITGHKIERAAADHRNLSAPHARHGGRRHRQPRSGKETGDRVMGVGTPPRERISPRLSIAEGDIRKMNHGRYKEAASWLRRVEWLISITPSCPIISGDPDAQLEPDQNLAHVFESARDQLMAFGSVTMVYRQPELNARKTDEERKS